MPTLELNGKLFAEQSGTGPVKLKIDELTESTANAGIRLAHPLKSSAGDDILNSDGIFKLKTTGSSIVASDGVTEVLSESSGIVTLNANNAVISGSSTGDLVRITQTGTGNALVVEDDTNPDSTPFVVGPSGNVGIGTSSPNGKLAVSDGTVVGEINPYSAASGCYIGTRTNHSILFQINAVEKMRIDTSGNVGIGTSSISERLEVNGRVKILASSAPTWDTNTRFWTESGFGTRYDGYQHRFDVGNSRAEAMRIDTSGNVKMYNNLRIDRGSTADYPLHLVSSGRYCTIGALNSTYVHIDTDSSSGIYFYDSISVASLDNRSDEVLKTNINTISDALSKVLAIRGVSFEWEVDKYPELKLKSGTNFGVIAQECESLHPEFVKESLHPTDENTSFKSLNYLELIPFLIEATKEQQALIESQQTQIDALTAKTQEQDLTIASLISRIEALENA